MPDDRMHLAAYLGYVDATKFTKRWIVATESYASLARERFSYEQYATRGGAEDIRDRINDDAERHGEKIRAYVVDRNDIAGFNL